MPNGLSEKGLSRAHNVKVTSFPDDTSSKIVVKRGGLIKGEPYDLVIHIGTNDRMNNMK